MTQNNPCKHEGKRVLLVEGNDDCHVVLALCQAHEVPETFGIYECGNDVGVLKRLNALIKAPDTDCPEIIGIVLDADRPDIAWRWQQIRDKLAHHAYPFPNNPDATGTIVVASDTKPKLGIWLMPNNSDPGMLEDFLTALAPPPGIAAAQHCVTQAQGLASFKEGHRSKAVIHTYLAWQDTPGKPLGQAVTSRVLQPDTEIAGQFTSWLTRLFSP